MEHQSVGLRRQGVGVARVALFVDGDNLSPSLAGAIIEAAGRLGRVDLRRVYAAEAGFRGWAGAAGFRAIQVGGAKNGTDLLLCIDAVEAACADDFDSFVIASDDRDFSHLAHWLRERGLQVLGLGTGKSSIGWRATCSRFGVLDEVQEPAPTPKPSSPPAKQVLLSNTDAKIREVILTEGEAGAIQIGRLGARMGALHKMTLDRLGATGWRAYLQARGNFYALDPKGPDARVRWIGG